MRRQHQLDSKRRDRGVERGRVDAGGDQARERFLARPRLRLPVGLARVLAAAAHAMMLFGDVGERQKMREGPRNRHCGRQGQAAQQIGETIEVIAAALVRALRDRAHLFDAIEEGVAFARAQRLPKKLTEQPHTVAERCMGIAHQRRTREGVRPPCIP